MKILLVCRVYPSFRQGGMPFVCGDRADELARQGHEVHVLTNCNSRPAEEIVNGVTVHHCRTDKEGEYCQQFADQGIEFSKKFSPDILHFDGMDTSRPWAGLRPGNPQVVALTLHGFGWGSFLTRWNGYRMAVDKERRCPEFNAGDMMKEADTFRNNFDAVFGVSEHEYSMLRDCYGIPHSHLVYNPIPPYFYSNPLKVPPKDFCLMAAAVHGHGTRGFHWAAEICNRMGIELKTYQNVPRSEMPSKYDECSAVILPTMYAQGFDLTVAEAFSRNRPVLASATGSYFREARNGGIRLFDMGNMKDMERVILCEKASHIGIKTLTLRQEFRPEEHVNSWFSKLGFPGYLDKTSEC